MHKASFYCSESRDGFNAGKPQSSRKASFFGPGELRPVRQNMNVATHSPRPTQWWERVRVQPVPWRPFVTPMHVFSFIRTVEMPSGAVACDVAVVTPIYVS